MKRRKTLSATNVRHVILAAWSLWAQYGLEVVPPKSVLSSGGPLRIQVRKVSQLGPMPYSGKEVSVETPRLVFAIGHRPSFGAGRTRRRRDIRRDGR